MLLFIVKTVPNIADDNLQIFKNLYMLKNHIVFSDIFSVTGTITKVYKVYSIGQLICISC